MKKVIILSELVLLAVFCKGQFSLGVGAGVSTHSPMAQLSINYQMLRMGADVGYSASLSASHPAYLTGQMYVNIDIGERLKLQPMGGMAYRYFSNDNKELNYLKPIYGVEINKTTGNDRGLWYFRYSLTDKEIIFVVGVRGIIN